MDLQAVQEVPVNVDNQQLSFLLEGSGSHGVDMHFSTDGHFRPGQGQGQVSVYPGQELYGKVTLSTLDPNLRVALSNCSGSTSMQHNSTDTSYSVLENRCPQDSTLVMDNMMQSTHQTFHLEAFKFLNSHTQVAPHCNITLCDNTDPLSLCATGRQSVAG